MKYDNYDRKDLIKIIGKRNNENYKSLFNHCFELLSSIVGKEQEKNNYDYDECFADFNDCVNQADWTIDLVNKDETFYEDEE